MAVNLTTRESRFSVPVSVPLGTNIGARARDSQASVKSDVAGNVNTRFDGQLAATPTIVFATDIEPAFQGKQAALNRSLLQSVSPGGIASGLVFGTPIIVQQTSGAQTVTLNNGIASTETFGSISLRGLNSALPSSIASQEAFSTPFLNLQRFLNPSGIDAFRNANVSAGFETTNPLSSGTRTTSKARSGSYSLQYTESQSPSLPTRYLRGDDFFWETWFNMDQPIFGFGVFEKRLTMPPAFGSTQISRFSLYVFRNGTEITGTATLYISYFTNGSSSLTAGAAFTLSYNTWYRATYEWKQDGTLTANIYNSSGTLLATQTYTTLSYQSASLSYLGLYTDNYIDDVTVIGREDSFGHQSMVGGAASVVAPSIPSAGALGSHVFVAGAVTLTPSPLPIEHQGFTEGFETGSIFVNTEGSPTRVTDFAHTGTYSLAMVDGTSTITTSNSYARGDDWLLTLWIYTPSAVPYFYLSILLRESLTATDPFISYDLEMFSATEANSTLFYTTGNTTPITHAFAKSAWYRIEMYWQNNGTVGFRLYNAGGTLIATDSASYPDLRSGYIQIYSDASIRIDDVSLSLPKEVANPTVAPGVRTALPTAIPSAETFGSQTLVAGTVSVIAPSIPSTLTLGSHTIVAGVATIGATAIPSALVFGTVSLAGGSQTFDEGFETGSSFIGSDGTVVRSTTYAKAGSYSLLVPNAKTASRSGDYVRGSEFIYDVWFKFDNLILYGAEDYNPVAYVRFAQSSTTSYYQLIALFYGNTSGFIDNTVRLRIQRVGTSGAVLGTTTSYILASLSQLNNWYRMRVTWNISGDITGTLYDEAGTALRTLTVNDNTYTSGYLSLASIGADTYFDEISLSAAPGAVTLLPTGMASGEVFGSAAITSLATVLPGGIASVEALGSHTLAAGAVSVVAPSIPSAAALGAHVFVAGQVTLGAQAIPSAFAAGTATLSAGAVSLLPGGIASALAFGTPSLTELRYVSPGGVASAAAFGAHNVIAGAITLAPGGIASGFAAGTHTFVAGVARITLAAGIPSGEAFGLPALPAGAGILTPAGISSGFIAGTATFRSAHAIFPGGIASAFTSGTATLRSVSVLLPTGVASAAAFGVAVVRAGAVVIQPTGMASSFAAGSATLSAGVALIQPTGMPSAFATGNATLAAGGVSILPSGMASQAALGSQTLRGLNTLLPAGVASAFVSGTAVVRAGAVTISMTGIPSAAAFGTAILRAGAVSILPTAIASSFTSGTATFRSATLLSPSGVPTAFAAGTHTMAVSGIVAFPSGIPSGQALGTHTLASLARILATGVPSAFAAGASTLVPGSVTLFVTGMGSGFAAGVATLRSQASLLPPGMPSTGVMGANPTVRSLSLLLPVGVPSGFQSGTANLFATVTLSPSGVPSSEALGAVAIKIETIFLVAPSAAYEGAFGDATVKGFSFIAVPSIRPTLAVGSILFTFRRNDETGPTRYTLRAKLAVPHRIVAKTMVRPTITSNAKVLGGWKSKVSIPASITIRFTVLGRAQGGVD